MSLFGGAVAHDMRAIGVILARFCAPASAPEHDAAAQVLRVAAAASRAPQRPAGQQHLLLPGAWVPPDPHASSVCALSIHSGLHRAFGVPPSCGHAPHAARHASARGQAIELTPGARVCAAGRRWGRQPEQCVVLPHAARAGGSRAARCLPRRRAGRPGRHAELLGHRGAPGAEVQAPCNAGVSGDLWRLVS